MLNVACGFFDGIVCLGRFDAERGAVFAYMLLRLFLSYHSFGLTFSLVPHEDV